MLCGVFAGSIVAHSTLWIHLYNMDAMRFARPFPRAEHCTIVYVELWERGSERWWGPGTPARTSVVRVRPLFTYLHIQYGQSIKLHRSPHPQQGGFPILHNMRTLY